MWASTVKVDGKKLAAVGQKQFTAIYLAPGTHKITMAWPLLSGQHGGGTTVDIADDGTVHYLEIVGTSRYAGGGYGVMYFNMGSGIGEVDPAHGARTVAECCKFKAPK